MSCTDSPTNRPTTGRYLDELMRELQLMTNLYETNQSVKFRNAHNLLVREIQRVLDVEMLSRGLSPSAEQQHAPRTPSSEDVDLFGSSSRMHGDESPLSSPMSSRRNSFSPTTMPSKRWLNYNGGGRGEAMSLSPEKPFGGGHEGSVERSDKLFFPEETGARNSNPIGRLIGPRGMTIRQLEKDFACKLFIRGKGCLKDEAKEARLSGRPSWEHLDEPIHVLITTRADTEQQCIEKLNLVKERLQDFLENPDSELKRAQLVHLAVIEGNLKS